MRSPGFTLIELLIAVAVLSIFVYCAYQVFIGGGRTANRAQWTNGVVEQLRNGTALINTSIKSSSYPTSLIQDQIFDPTDNKNTSIARQYFLKILKNKEDIPAPSGKEKLKLMSWVVCVPEKPQASPPKPGKLIKNELWFLPKQNTLVQVGDLKLLQESYDFTTSPNEYARTGTLSLTHKENEDKGNIIVSDVKFVRLNSLAKSIPSLATETEPMEIKIRCQYPKEPNLMRENSIMMTPNVGIDLL